MPVDDDDDMRSGSERHSAHRDDKKRSPREERKGMVKKKGKRGGVTTKPLHKFLSEEPMDEELESSGLDVASASGQMTQGELQEVADNAPPGAAAASASKNAKRKRKRKLGIGSRKCSSGILWVALPCSWVGTRPDGQTFSKFPVPGGSHVGPQSAMSDSFSLFRTRLRFHRCCCRYQRLFYRDAGMDVPGMEEERMAARRTWLVRCPGQSGWVDTMEADRPEHGAGRMSAWALVLVIPLSRSPRPLC